MPNHRTVFNHIGLCVADRERSRRFYEGLLGFQFWWELELPDEGTAALLQLDGPIGVRATYLRSRRLGAGVARLLETEVAHRPERVMDEVGLTHMSLSVSDLAGVLTQVESFGGSVVKETTTEQFAMIRDPDGQLIELLPDGWLAALAAAPVTNLLQSLQSVVIPFRS